MLPAPTSSNDCLSRRRGLAVAALLACWMLTGSAWADPATISPDRIFQPVDFNTYDVMTPGPEDGVPLAGQPYQDFTVQPPPRTFPNCRLPLLSWRLGPGPECGVYPNVPLELPAHAVRKASWY